MVDHWDAAVLATLRCEIAMAKHSRTVSEPIVLVGGVDENLLKVRSVYRGVGGTQLDYAILYWDPRERFVGTNVVNDVLHDLDLRDEFVGRALEIYVETEDDIQIVHAGQVSEVRAVMDADQLGLEVVSKIQPYHFGFPTYGMVANEKQPAGGNKDIVILEPIVFNPEIDGQIVGNMSTRRDERVHYFLDPESSRSTQALEWHGESAGAAKNKLVTQWTLAKAVLHLMDTLNVDIGGPGNPFGRNPFAIRNWPGSISQLEQLLSFQPLRNQRLPNGIHLMEALDRLLSPYGWRPYVHYEGLGRRRIDFMRIGDVRQRIVKLSHQRFGQAYDPDLTFVEGLDVRARIDDRLVNILVVFGDYEYVESSFELFRAWGANLDATEFSDLNLDSDAYQAHPEYARVYRDFVLNEGGDYIGLRPEITKPYDLSELFQTTRVVNGQPAVDKRTIVKRRKFLPTISLRRDGTPAGDVGGIRVQWRQTLAEEWRDVPTGVSIRVLERECGIRFDDVSLPPELREAVMIRVTATLQSDQRIRFTAEADKSINSQYVYQILELPERFAKKTIHKDSSYLIDAIGLDLGTGGEIPPINQSLLKMAEVDDTLRIKQFAELLLNTWNQGTVEGDVTLPALDWIGYELGNRVDGLQLRKVFWPVHHSEQRFPQIVGITYQVPAQQMTLHLDTPREDIPPEAPR